MIHETLTYTDFGGTQRTEDFYFNLTEAEVINMALSKEGGMEAYINKIVNSKNQIELVKLFQDVLRISYGKKSEDGRKFEKSPEIFADFASTQAYSDFYMSLVTNTEKAIAFINGLCDTKPKAEPAPQSAGNAPIALPGANI